MNLSLLFLFFSFLSRHVSLYKAKNLPRIITSAPLINMGLLLHKDKYALFILAYLITIFHKCDGVTLVVNGYGQRLNTSGPLLTPIGQKQCMEECLRRGDCLSVNYWRSQLRCQLNPAVVGPGLALIPDSSGVYMEKSSQPQVCNFFYW